MIDIKQFFFKRALQRMPKREKHFPNYPLISTVLILFESDNIERNKYVKSIIKQLQEDGKEVTAWGFIDKKNIQSAVLRDYRILGSKDINLIGKPKSDLLEEFTWKHFDMLIDLNTNNLLALKYLALYARADFKAGGELAQVKEDTTGTPMPYLHDFILQVDSEHNTPQYCFEQIMFYLNNIISND